MMPATPVYALDKCGSFYLICPTGERAINGKIEKYAEYAKSRQAHLLTQERQARTVAITMEGCTRIPKSHSLAV
jgi:hypothetical protein